MCEVHHTPKWGNRASTRHAGCEMGCNQAADIVFYGCAPSPDACGRPTSAPVSSSIGGQPPSPLLGARPITASNPNFVGAPRHFKVVPHRHHWGVRSTLKTRGSRYGIYKLILLAGQYRVLTSIHERGGLILSEGHNRFAAHTQRRAQLTPPSEWRHACYFAANASCRETKGQV